MNEENFENILTWSGVCLATAWLILFATLAGSDDAWQTTNSNIPYYVSVLSNGISHMAKYHYAIAAFILAIAISLPIDDFLAGIKKSSKVALYTTVIPIVASLWSFLTIPVDVTGSVGDSAASGILHLIVIAISATAGIFFALKIWAALAAATMLFLIAIQTALRLILPHVVEGYESDDGVFRAEHSVVTLGLVGLTVYFLGLIPGIGYQSHAEKTSPVAVWETLQAPDGATWMKSASGLQRIKRRIADIEDAYKRAKKEPCETESGPRLVFALNSYFKKIRFIEDWRPGTELSETSKGGLSHAKRALDNEMVDWLKLSPAVRIHLDNNKYKDARHRFPDKCATGL